jgi:hypothetical protein
MSGIRAGLTLRWWRLRFWWRNTAAPWLLRNL